MIISIDTEGQLCNRLWGFLPLLEQHHLTGERIYVLFFDEYRRLFPALNTCNELHFIRSLLPASINNKNKIAVRRLVGNGRFIYKKPLRNHVRGCALVIAWDHRDEHVEETRKRAIQLFRPSETVINTINGVFSSLRTTNTVVLGIHMRKRDYRIFDQGRFFYSDAEYRSFILQVKNQVEPLGYSLRCLLCSDEPIDRQSFQDLDVECIQPSGPMEDLYALSACDLIVGPPSTFSQWASYYGEVPLKLVWDKTTPLNIHEFGVCTSLDQTRHIDMEGWLRERSQSRNAPFSLPNA